jgi:Protein of unknown function (DUF1592)/Protein of unknown function (DUF1588)/Protein of unknown function (DUF1595)/Protein of unknown function (DUF1585)/Protein of unknown function (DUF1587)
MHKPVLLLIAILTLPLLGCGSSDPDAIGGPLTMRRLSPEQYKNAIEDAFGSKVEVAGRFEPDSRRDGLNALGASFVAVTPSGFEQYEAIARNVSAQVVSEELREEILPCTAKDDALTDAACTASIIEHIGQKLLRRPLSSTEIQSRVEAAAHTSTAQNDYYAGLALALTSLMVAPEFLFRIEEGVQAPTAEQPGRLLLSDYSVASKLSYFLWNRGPDEALMAAAASGELSTPEGLAKQVDRMLASEHMTLGVRAFFEDMFMFDAFDDLGKDVARYPFYNVNVARDAREQTLRFIADQLLDKEADYRSLFTSKELPMTRSLGPVYGLPVRVAEGWEDVTLPASNPRAGLLSHASFNMLYAHPGRSSATLRGVFMREALLCQKIPEAPADVDFTQFSQDDSAVHKTARERLEVHSTEASCRKCHKLTDPIGLGLEVYDGIGRHRTAENGATIDTSGDLDGVAFKTPVELGVAFSENPLINACLVQNMYRYAVGRKQTQQERGLLRHLENSFVNNGHRVPALMRDIALSEAFRTASKEQTNTEDAVASAEASQGDKS